MIQGARVLVLDGIYGCGNVGRVLKTHGNLVLVDLSERDLGRAWLYRIDLRVLEEEVIKDVRDRH